MSNRKIADKYYRKVRRALRCSPGKKRELLDAVKSDIEEYVTREPAATENDLVVQFGQPTEYAAAYIATLDNVQLHKQMSQSRFIKRLWVIVGAVVIITVVVGVLLVLHKNNATVARYYSEDTRYSVAV